MKTNKLLLFVLAVTFLTASNGIFAYSAFNGFYNISTDIPAFNGSKTFTKMGYELPTGGYQGQAITNVTIEPSYDTLDVRLVQKSSSTSAGLTNGWKILENGKDTVVGEGNIFGFPADEFEYKLTIDSRWNYTKPTKIVGTWGFYNE